MSPISSVFSHSLGGHPCPPPMTQVPIHRSSSPSLSPALCVYLAGFETTDVRSRPLARVTPRIDNHRRCDILVLFKTHLDLSQPTTSSRLGVFGLKVSLGPGLPSSAFSQLAANSAKSITTNVILSSLLQIPGLCRPSWHNLLLPFNRNWLRCLHRDPHPPLRRRRPGRGSHRGERAQPPPRVHACPLLP